MRELQALRNSEKILSKLSDLLITNHELENIYLEACKTVENDSLKAFFKSRSNERKKYTEQLYSEIEKLVGESKFSEIVNKDSYKVSMRFRSLIFQKDDNLLIREIYRIKQLTINKYNALLSELNLPLSVCKLLVGQRDGIQASMNAIKRVENVMSQSA